MITLYVWAPSVAKSLWHNTMTDEIGSTNSQLAATYTRTSHGHEYDNIHAQLLDVSTNAKRALKHKTGNTYSSLRTYGLAITIWSTTWMVWFVVAFLLCATARIFSYMVITLRRHRFGLGIWLNASHGASYDYLHDDDGSQLIIFPAVQLMSHFANAPAVDDDVLEITMNTPEFQVNAVHMIQLLYIILVLVVRPTHHATIHDTHIPPMIMIVVVSLLCGRSAANKDEYEQLRAHDHQHISDKIHK